MKTDDQRPHPFLLEDVQLRLEVSISKLAGAADLCQELATSLTKEEDRNRFGQIHSDVVKFLRVSRSYAFHIRETNIAMLLRGDLESSRPLTAHLIEEMKSVLQADAENQEKRGVVMERLKQFEAEPAGFVKQWLLPLDKDIREKGIFSLTTR